MATLLSINVIINLRMLLENVQLYLTKWIFGFESEY